MLITFQKTINFFISKLSFEKIFSDQFGNFFIRVDGAGFVALKHN